MAKTLKELKSEADELKIEFADDVKVADLAKLIKDKKAELKKADDENKGNDNKPKPKGKGKFIFLKSRAYINDKERCEAGLYQLAEIPARFKKLTAEAVEIFDGMEGKDLVRVAKYFGVDANKHRKDSELLEVLLKTKIEIVK